MPVQAAGVSQRPGNHATGADESLLVSKITAPGLPGWIVPRRRIEKLLAAGTRKPLTLITGPPGAGKTIVTASWLAAGAGPGPVAWMSVDRYDNRPETFWSYLAEAFRQAGVTGLPAEPACERGDCADHHFLLRLAAVLAAQDPPVVLVLDDIHLLTRPRTLDDLGYVLQHARAGLRLVTTSRMDPLLPLHRFRLTGDLTEIRAVDLAFTVGEAGQLIAQHGITLSPPALETLTRRNEGWAAGLRLAALSMRGHPDPDQFVKEFGAEDSAVLGYLVDEVLDVEPARTRDLLMKTSILDRVSAGLAAELTGDRQAPGALPALAQANAFVQPLGHGWYRYHPVLAEVLRLKLRREARCDVRDLHRRAAAWFRRNGTLADAAGQAAAAGDWGLAARAVIDELAAALVIESPAGEPLAGQFRQMPADPVPGQAPPLLVQAAIAVRDRHADLAGRLLAAAQDRLDRLPAGEEIGSRLAAAQIRLALARQAGDLGCADDAAADAESLLGKLPGELAARRPEARAQVTAGRGAVELWHGRFDRAAPLLEAGAAGAISDRERADCIGQLALLEAVRGRLGRAAELAAAAADGPPGFPVPRAAAEVALAWTHLEHDRVADARSQLARAEEALRARPDKLIAALAHLVAARCSVAAGRPRAATEMIGRARRGWSPPPWLDRRMIIVGSAARAAAGDARAAVADARRAGPESAPEAAVALARAWLAAGSQEAASQALAAAPATEPGGMPDPVALEACLADAALRYRAGDRASGRRSLEQALRIAEPERLRLPIRLERYWLEPVLQSDPALARSFRRLLGPSPSASGQVTPSGTGPGPSRQVYAGQPAPVVVEQLSQREREVLERASGMLSTAEIADELYLSVNTVKSHLRSIFRKLGASRRGEAVRRAQQLRLL